MCTYWSERFERWRGHWLKHERCEARWCITAEKWCRVALVIHRLQARQHLYSHERATSLAPSLFLSSARALPLSTRSLALNPCAVCLTCEAQIPLMLCIHRRPTAECSTDVLAQQSSQSACPSIRRRLLRASLRWCTPEASGANKASRPCCPSRSEVGTR
jgi:hypothetical protein